MTRLIRKNANPRCEATKCDRPATVLLYVDDSRYGFREGIRKVCNTCLNAWMFRRNPEYTEVCDNCGCHTAIN